MYGVLKVIMLIVMAVFIPLNADDTAIVKAKSSEIGKNLDLEAVATVFGDSHDLQEFERKLNDSTLNISNLDLNGDGIVDYLRVLDISENGIYVVVIQAVVGKNMFQDVATIDVIKDNHGETIVQVIGNIYLYGPGYILQPDYATPPLILIWFSSPYYAPWSSSWNWEFYPPYYHQLQPSHINRYHPNVNTPKNKYRHLHKRHSKKASILQNKISRDDYAIAHPSFASSNKRIENRYELQGSLLKKHEHVNIQTRDKDTQTSTLGERRVMKDWKRTEDRNRQEGKVRTDAVPVLRNGWRRTPVDSTHQIRSQKPTFDERPLLHIQRQPSSEDEEEKSRSGWTSHPR